MPRFSQFRRDDVGHLLDAADFALDDPDMPSPELAAIGVGAVAGLGVAMPIGPVGVLLLREGIERGFPVALGAAAGVATVDAAYAVVAVVAGSSVAEVIDAHRGVVRLAATVVLVVIAGWGLAGVWRQWLGVLAARADAPVVATRAAGAPDGSPAELSAEPPAQAAEPLASTPLRAWLRFVALTVVNPMTALTFATVAISLIGRLERDSGGAVGASSGLDWPTAAAFIGGVAIASAAWQTVIAAAGALAGRRLSVGWRLALSAAGHGVVVILAAAVFFG